LGISGHAPRRLEAQNRRGASSFTIFTFTLCLPPSFSLLCALLLHSSLSLTLLFSLSRILSCIFFLLIFSLIHGVLTRVLFSPISHFRLLVLFSLSTRGMFSYLCMLGMLSGCLYHRFRVSKFFGLKNFKMAITFDRKLGLRRSKNESFSKLRNEAPRPYPKGIRQFFFSKFHRLPYFFNSFVLFFNFLDFSLLFHLFILVKKFWKLLWLLFVCIGDLSK